MMDLPEEELKQPLVPAPVEAALAPSRSPRHHMKGQSPRRKQGLLPIGHNSSSGDNYVAMGSNAPHIVVTEEEEKHEAAEPDMRQKQPYSAPNVHPYAVPQYEPNAYGGRGGGWGGREPLVDQSRIPTIDIVFSGMYTLAAALTIIQGFGMLIHFTLAAMILGVYTMAFGCAVIMYDLKSVVYGVSVEQYFPFLGNYIGRALTIAFFAALCGQTFEYAGWTRLIVLYNLLVATLQGFVYFTTKTVTPTEHSHMEEDLADI
ncbi:hypothetical protein PINS_up001520 [Pythium insidiosum]|nr:hypothetical protein PINS_up001520 [Pythium insidiosum]